MNLLAGSLFGAKLGTVYCVVCNAFGALACFTWSKIFAGELMEHSFIKPKAQYVQSLVEGHQDNLFWYITFLRLFPGSPNWAMNLCYPHIGIPGNKVFFSVFIGLIPWNLLVCEAGAVI